MPATVTGQMRAREMSETIDSSSVTWPDDAPDRKPAFGSMQTGHGHPAAMILAVWAVCAIALSVAFWPHPW